LRWSPGKKSGFSSGERKEEDPAQKTGQTRTNEYVVGGRARKEKKKTKKGPNPFTARKVKKPPTLLSFLAGEGTLGRSSVKREGPIFLLHLRKKGERT